MALGDVIKDLRLKMGLNQQQLCDVLSIEQSTLANYENNRRTPKPDMLNKLADYFDVTVDYLLEREPRSSATLIAEVKAKSNSMPHDADISTEEVEALKKEPTAEMGSLEWFKDMLVSAGIMEEDGDLTDEQLSFTLTNLRLLVKMYSKKA